MSLATYWLAIVRNLKNHVSSRLQPLHNQAPDPNDRRIAEAVLRLTLCQNLPDEHLSSKVLALREEALNTLQGDWRRGQITWFCPGMCASETECRAAGVDAVTSVIMKLIFKSKITIPVLSRWWKCSPCAQKLLLGLSCHRILSDLAPSQPLGEQAPADAPPGDWHAQQSFRIRSTFLWFNNGGTIANLILYLKTLGPEQHMMAWVMKLDNRQVPSSGSQRASFPDFFGQPARSPGAVALDQTARRDVILQFMLPSTSPAWRCLEEGRGLLDPDLEIMNWEVLWHFSPGGKSVELLQRIWASVLSLLAKFWWKVCGESETCQ
eukprot:4571662-Pyramimonas_sp.AAC.1